jgi:hypothetical protein
MWAGRCYLAKYGRYVLRGLLWRHVVGGVAVVHWQPLALPFRHVVLVLKVEHPVHKLRLTHALLQLCDRCPSQLFGEEMPVTFAAVAL